jgi:hypothetical protein
MRIKPAQSIATYYIRGYTTPSHRVKSAFLRHIPHTQDDGKEREREREGGLNIFSLSLFRAKITRKRKVVCWGFCPPSTSVTFFISFVPAQCFSLSFFLFPSFFHTFLGEILYTCRLFPPLSWSFSNE